jgi:hypothetical protein
VLVACDVYFQSYTLLTRTIHACIQS